MNRIRKVVIPAGGLGERLAPLSRMIPKEMLPLGGRVVLQYVLEECDGAGLDTVLVVLNRRKTALFAIGEETPCPADPVTGIPRRSVYFANQSVQGGLAHAVLHAEAFVGDEPFAVALGDTVIHGGERSLLERMLAAHREHGAAATVAAQEVPEEQVSLYGILAPAGAAGEVFPVSRIHEKPGAGEAPSRLAITARYVLSPEIFQACRECPRNAKGEIELTEAMSHLAACGRPVIAVRLDPGQRRLDIGNIRSYTEAFRQLA